MRGTENQGVRKVSQEIDPDSVLRYSVVEDEVEAQALHLDYHRQ